MKLYNIFQEIIIEEVAKARLLNEGVSVMDVNKAIDDRVNVNIYYDDKPNAKIPTKPRRRYIQPYAIGTSLAGNDVLRAFQIFGSQNKGEIGSWKFFRLDRIRGWEPTKMKFHKPIEQYATDPSLIPSYNPNGDGSMRRLDKKVRFKGDPDIEDIEDEDDKPYIQPKPAFQAGLGSKPKPKLSGPVPKQTPIAKPEPKKVVLKPEPVQVQKEPEPAQVHKEPEPAIINKDKDKKNGNTSISRPKQVEKHFG